MVTLQHAIKIAAPRHAAWEALTTLAGMQSWHLGKVEGAIAVGEILFLAPRPDLRFGWRTERLEPGICVVQTAMEEPTGSLGKTLTITCSDLPDGGTLVQLTDGEWPADDTDLPFCNTRWGEALVRLRDTLEANMK